MPGTDKFMADLLAITASTQQSEDQQIEAATKLAMAFTADLKDSLDKLMGKTSGDEGLISAHSAIIAEQGRHPLKSPAWRVLHAAENVIGDQKINRRPPARATAQKSRP
jgi:phosphohistidine swiveling domain-containing protein